VAAEAEGRKRMEDEKKRPEAIDQAQIAPGIYAF
jgi:hypothetical protein